MEFRYQDNPSDKAVRIANVHSERVPLVIDYSDQFTNNQPSQTDELVYTSTSGLVYDDSSETFNITGDIKDDRKLITLKSTTDNVPLYYQYQPKYDVIHPENIQIFDEDNNLVKVNLEYGYISDADAADRKGSPMPITDNSNILFDPLDSRSERGNFTTSAFIAVDSLITDTNFTNLPFNIYGDCLYTGSIDYLDDDNQLSTSKTIEFTLGFRANPSEDKNIVVTDEWVIVLNTSGELYTAASPGDTIQLQPNVWYRIKLNVGVAGTVEVYNDNNIGSIATNLTAPSTMTINSDSMYIFHLGISEEVLAKSWNTPLYIPRYGKTLFWSADKPTGESLYRVRVLLPDNKTYVIKYDGATTTTEFFKNEREWINQELIYKKFEQITAHDWYYDGTSTIYFSEHAHDDLNAQLNSDTHINNIKVYTTPSDSSNLSVIVSDDKLIVTNGIFRSDNYEVGGNEDYYYIPEYDRMPFAADGQGIIEPEHVKIVKEIADVVSDNTFQIEPFTIHEGSYPDYTIPNIYEKLYDVEEDAASSSISDVVDTVSPTTFSNARGINIYIDNVLIDNSLIEDYNMNHGTIKLNATFTVNTDVRVTYIKKAIGFISPYPRLDRYTSNGNSYRIFIRAWYPGYGLDHPEDSLINSRVTYMALIDGVPVEPMRNCMTNEIITKSGDEYLPFDGVLHPHAHIADITMIEKITSDDARIQGGGIKEKLDDSYEFSESYLDIVNADGLQIPQAITFIKIPDSLRSNLIAEFISAGRTEVEAIDFLKDHIQKYIGLGVFYVIVDENDNPIDKPYPIMEENNDR